MLSSTDEERIIENNKQIQRLLEENERILQKSGYTPPVNNLVLDPQQRLQIPRGYLRTSGKFYFDYHLNEISDKKVVKDNISYALQLSDCYNYFITRFNIWGSVGALFQKQAFINIISIIEALIFESTHNLNKKCDSCIYIPSCTQRLNRNDRHNAKNAIQKLVSLNLLHLSPQDVSKLLYFIDLRNRIHIRLADGNEFLDAKFSIASFNDALRLLKLVRDDICKSIVPQYNVCSRAKY